MRVFLTGGTGLVGSHSITKMLAAGHTIDALVRTADGAALVSSLGAEPITGHLQDPDLWDSIEHEAIVHSAAALPKSATWEEFQSVNVQATQLVARAAARTGARLVYLSTVAIYGTAGYAGDGSAPIVEQTRIEPLHELDYYGRSKRAAENVIWETVRGTSARAVALRPCVIYGERDRIFSPRIIKVMRFGYWPLAGSGNNTLTVVYAGNVADAVVTSLEHREITGAFNITNDGFITQRSFFEAIALAAGRKVSFLPVPQAIVAGTVAVVHGYKTLTSFGRYGGFVGAAARWLHRDNPYSSEKAEKELHWRPSTKPDKAARLTGEWYRHLDSNPRRSPPQHSFLGKFPL